MGRVKGVEVELWNVAWNSATLHATHSPCTHPIVPIASCTGRHTCSTALAVPPPLAAYDCLFAAPTPVLLPRAPSSPTLDRRRWERRGSSGYLKVSRSTSGDVRAAGVVPGPVRACQGRTHPHQHLPHPHSARRAHQAACHRTGAARGETPNDPWQLHVYASQPDTTRAARQPSAPLPRVAGWGFHRRSLLSPPPTRLRLLAGIYTARGRDSCAPASAAVCGGAVV